MQSPRIKTYSHARCIHYADPEFARFSPSQLLVWKILEAAFARGILEFDFLGDADEWKLVWAQKTREVSWMIVYSKSLRGRVVQLLKLHAARWVRRLSKGPRQSLQRPAH